MKLNNKISSQPRKVRKRLIYQAPLHLKRKMLTAPLSKEAIMKYGVKRFQIRVGDKVLVKKGKFKGHIGKVDGVDIKRMRIFIDGVTRKKVDKSTVHVPIRPWNVEILELDLSDEKRKKALERKKAQASLKI
ncbi:MAG: 50S ribosomal protein L24 [Candidatus Njordarchaeia archaeon]